MASGQSDSPTVREPPTAHKQWVLLHGGQGSISLEYQTYTSAHPFYTLVSGLGTVAIYQRLVVAGGGFFPLLDLGPGAAACGMGIEINTE